MSILLAHAGNKGELFLSCHSFRSSRFREWLYHLLIVKPVYGNSVAIISEALGHDSEKTTRIYLASMEEEKLDAANASILAFLNR